MSEISRPWAGDTTGDAGPYTDENWRDIYYAAFTRRQPNIGVIADVYSDLQISGAGSPLNLGAGSAFVHGTYYEMDAADTLAVPSPAVSTRIDRIVVRMSWTNQEARITRIAGVEGGGVPAMTQSVGVTWDIPLYQASITTGGVITLTDEREYIQMEAAEDQPFTYYFDPNKTSEVTIRDAIYPAAQQDFVELTWDGNGTALDIGADLTVAASQYADDDVLMFKGAVNGEVFAGGGATTTSIYLTVDGVRAYIALIPIVTATSNYFDAYFEGRIYADYSAGYFVMDYIGIYHLSGTRNIGPSTIYDGRIYTAKDLSDGFTLGFDVVESNSLAYTKGRAFGALFLESRKYT